MDIQEVGIGAEKKKTKKVSPKIINASQRWLQGKGVDLEDLNEPQREAVFHLIKQKRGLFWLILISLPCIIIYAFGISVFFKFVQGDDASLIPQKYEVENESGEKIYQDVPESLKESINLYGKLCLLFGAFIGGMFYMFASTIAGPIIQYHGIKHNEKTISVFLPNNGG